MTDPQTDIEVGIDPNEPSPEFRGVEVKGVAKYVIYGSLGLSTIGLALGFAAKTWTLLYIALTLFALGVIEILVVAELERRKSK